MVTSDGRSDVLVQSAGVQLSIGKRYELSAWIRTEDLQVRDTDRTPIATGAAVTLDSMPFDVHSESLGGTRDWTRVRLRFTATRAEDHVALTAGSGGRMSGRAWFDSIAIEEVSAQPGPSEDAVQVCGPLRARHLE